MFRDQFFEYTEHKPHKKVLIIIKEITT